METGNLLLIENADKSYQQAIEELEQRHTDAAITMLTELAHNGYRKAMVTLARIYYNGKGVNVDNGMAIQWLSKAAEMGSYIACWFLGNIYYDMGDTEENNRQAWKYYSLAASMRGKANFYVGRMIIENRVRNIDTIWSVGFDDDERIEVGVSYYQDALTAKYPLAGLYMWKVYLKYGLTDEAERFYKQGEQLLQTPSDFNNWAYTLSEWGEHAKAPPYIRKCLDMVSDEALCTYMLDTYAEVLYGLGRLDESEDMFNICLQLALDAEERRCIHETKEKIRMKFYQS